MNAGPGTYKRAMLDYIFYSTIFGLFSAALVYKAGFDIHLVYLLMLSNLVLMLLISRSLRIPRWVGYLILYFLLNGTIGLLRGTDTVAQFAKEFLGITANAVFYAYFFRLYKGDFMRAFEAYARAAYGVCLLGFPILVGESIHAGHFVRLHSVSSEPAAFAELIVPAFFWYVCQFLTQRRCRREVVIFAFAMALSVSSLGYLGVAFGIFLLPFRRPSWLFATPIIATVLLGSIYAVSPDFKMRTDETAAALLTSDVSGSSLSAFALVSNLLVARNVFHESPWVGNGLGSHVVSYKRFIAYVPGADVVPEGFEGANAAEASSLAIRLLSEQGLLGIAFVIWFLVKFHVGGSSTQAIVSNALLTSFLIKLIRDGIYFGPEQFFFVTIYILNYRHFVLRQKRSLMLLKRDFSSPRTLGKSLCELSQSVSTPVDRAVSREASFRGICPAEASGLNNRSRSKLLPEPLIE